MPSAVFSQACQSRTTISLYWLNDSIQILTALRGTVKIIGPRWCQNHDYAWSVAEGCIVMVLTSPNKGSRYLFYIPNEKNAKFKSIFHFDRLFTKLKIINVNGAGSLRLSHNYRPIDYAPGIVILAGIVKIMPALLTNQMTGIFRWGI